MSAKTAPRELGPLLGTLVVDSSVSCPVAQFGRLVVSEWESTDRTVAIKDIVQRIASRCSAEEEQLSRQLDQLAIARDKLSSELQRVEAQTAAAEKKRQEAGTYRGFCATVMAGLAVAGKDIGDAFTLSQPPSDSTGFSGANAGSNKQKKPQEEEYQGFFATIQQLPAPQASTSANEEPFAREPIVKKDAGSKSAVSHQDPLDQHREPHLATRHDAPAWHGEVSSHHVSIQHADPNPHPHSASEADRAAVKPAPPPTTGGASASGNALLGEVTQLMSLLKIPDVKEQTLIHSLSRCESTVLLKSTSQWASGEEKAACLQLVALLSEHLPTPRPPLQVLEIRILRAVAQRVLANSSARSGLDDLFQGPIFVMAKLLNSVNDDVKSEAVLFLLEVSIRPECKAQFCLSDGVDALVNIVSTSTNELLLEQSLRLVNALMEGDRPHRIRLLNAGVMLPMVDLLYSESLPILDVCLTALQLMTREDEARVRMREEQGLEKCVSSLHFPDPRVVAKAAGLIWNCAGLKENRVAFKQLGCIPALLQALRTPDSEIHLNVSGALWNLSVEPDCRTAIFEYMGVSPLLDLLKSDQEAVVSNTTGAIWNCTALPEFRQAVKKENGLPELLKLLTYPSTTVQDNAAGALRNCAINDSTKITLRELGAFELIIDLLNSVGSATQEKFVSILFILTVAPDNKHALRTVNGFPKLVELILSKPNEKGLLEKTVATLRNCAVVAENKIPMVEAGVVAALAGLGKPPERILSASLALKEALLQCLHQLGRETTVKERMRKDGAMHISTALLKDTEDSVVGTAAGVLAVLTSVQENRDTLRDCGGLERLIALVTSTNAAAQSVGPNAPRSLNLAALEPVLSAIRYGTGNNTTNQRLCVGLLPVLLGIIRTFSPSLKNLPSTAAPAQSNERTPEDIVRECLLCIKNISSERTGCDALVAANGIQQIQALELCPNETIKKAVAMVLQSVSRLTRIQTIGGGGVVSGHGSATIVTQSLR